MAIPVRTPYLYMYQRDLEEILSLVKNKGFTRCEQVLSHDSARKLWNTVNDLELRNKRFREAGLVQVWHPSSERAASDAESSLSPSLNANRYSSTNRMDSVKYNRIVMSKRKKSRESSAAHESPIPSPKSYDQQWAERARGRIDSLNIHRTSLSKKRDRSSFEDENKDVLESADTFSTSSSMDTTDMTETDLASRWSEGGRVDSLTLRKAILASNVPDSPSTDSLVTTRLAVRWAQNGRVDSRTLNKKKILAVQSNQDDNKKVPFPPQGTSGSRMEAKRQVSGHIRSSAIDKKEEETSGKEGGPTSSNDDYAQRWAGAGRIRSVRA